MGPIDAVKSCFRHYVNPKGRAGRGEFWWFLLFVLVIEAVLSALATLTGDSNVVITDYWWEFASSRNIWFSALGALFSLAVLLPLIMVQIRRFHDQNRSGWWLLLHLVPGFGNFIVLVFMAIGGTFGPNRYGPGRYDPSAAFGAQPQPDTPARATTAPADPPASPSGNPDPPSRAVG